MESDLLSLLHCIFKKEKVFLVYYKAYQYVYKVVNFLLKVIIFSLPVLSQIIVPFSFWNNIQAGLVISNAPKYDYGTIITSTSVDKTFTVTNMSARAAVNLAGGSFVSSVFNFKGGAYPGTGGTCTTSLAGSASCTVIVTAFSAVSGLYNDTVALSYTDNVGRSTSRSIAAYFSTWNPSSLGANLVLWLDVADNNNVTLQYASTGATATGNSGSTLLVTSSDVSASLPIGTQLRLGSDTTNVYVVTAISGTNITVSPSLAMAYTTQILSKGQISTLTDKSGNGKDATQPTAASQPTYLRNNLNNLPCASFLTTATVMGGVSGTYQTITAVRKQVSGGYRTLFASAANTDYSLRSTGGGAASYGDASPFNTNDWANGATPAPAMWINGTNTVSFTLNQPHIIATYGSSAVTNTYSLSSTFMTRGMTGGDYVCEFIITNNQISTTDRQKAEGYLAWKWGIQSSLPAPHPYKAAPP